jgi:4-azaleucine resistance transporter AzlC
MQGESSVRAGSRRGAPLVLPTLALGVSFGVTARPVMGVAAPITMSVLVFSGGAQFAALNVLSAGGALVSATVAAVLMNARWLPMSFALAPSLTGRPGKRALEAQAIVDASFAIAGRGDGTFDRGLLIGATLPQASAWITGTIAGVFASGLLHNPDALGLDAVFPAFYLALLAEEIRARTEPRERRTVGTVIALATAITLGLMLFSAPGLPTIAASGAALAGLRARGSR